MTNLQKDVCLSIDFKGIKSEFINEVSVIKAEKAVMMPAILFEHRHITVADLNQTLKRLTVLI